MKQEHASQLMVDYLANRPEMELTIFERMREENPVLHDLLQATPDMMEQTVGPVNAATYRAAAALTYELLAESYRGGEIPLPRVTSEVMTMHAMFNRTMVQHHGSTEGYILAWADYLEGEAPGLILYLAQTAEQQGGVATVHINELVLGAADIMYPFKLREMMESTAREYDVPVPTIVEMLLSQARRQSGTPDKTE